MLDTFDRYVFESIVEKVIVGGYDEDGNKDPSMLTFIYKTGFKNSLDGTNFKPPRKNSKAAKQSAGLCSHTTDEAKSMYSYHSDDTYRNSGTFIAEIGGFTALFGEVQSVCHPFATRKNKKDVMKEERVNMLNNQHVRPYNML